MKAFVTGATGFIGGRLARRLLQKGYEVTALVRSEHDAQTLQAAGIKPVLGDIRNRESMRAGMQGSDVVFHTAAWYKIGSPDWRLAEEINVQGTRNVIGLAHELGIPKIIYTSTVAVFGDTRGQVVDESYQNPGEPFLSEYDRTKWKAHFEATVPLIEQGAPVIIVMPGAVYGPGDHSQAGEMMVWFLRGRFPVFPAPNLRLTFAHVDDIVEGHLLAAEKGLPGESYILAGPVYAMKDMVNLWARISGRPAPLLFLPPALVKPFAPLMGWVSTFLPLPNLLQQEAVAMVNATYTARSDKAQQELGWQVRSVEEGMRETLAALSQTITAPPPETIRRQHLAMASLVASAVLFLLWILRRRR